MMGHKKSRGRGPAKSNFRDTIPTVGLWQRILPAFGIDAQHLRNQHGPCPGCSGRDRFRFDDKDGRGTWYCGGGGNPTHGDGYALLSHVHGWDNSRAFREVQEWLNPQGADSQPQATPQVSTRSNTQKYALQLWREAVAGVSFHPYAQAKGITWEAGARRHTRVSGRVVGKNADCILVPIRNIATDAVVAVQAINSDGKKQTFGRIKGHGFVCGNTLDPSIRWFVVEGWADAVSLVFHEYQGDAVAFAALGLNNMDVLAQRAADVFGPDEIIVLEDAAA